MTETISRRGDIEIRESAASDGPALMALYPRAFPEEDLLPLLRRLLDAPAGVLSLVALAEGRLIGHVAVTTCRVSEGSGAAALLGPLAVAPDAQRRGVGSELTRHGLARLAASGAAQVFVLGDPAYYRRFGFTVERAVTPPFPIPELWADAWRSLRMDAASDAARGALIVPEPWRDPALWGG